MKVKITIKKVLAGMLAVLMLASNIFAVPSVVMPSVFSVSEEQYEEPYLIINDANDSNICNESYALENEAVLLTTPQTVTTSEVMTKINDLVTNLNGKYFTVNQSACSKQSCNSNGGCNDGLNSNVVNASWFKNLFGTVSVNRFPAHWCADSKKYTNGEGWSCYGFATFAQWYIFSSQNSDTVVDNLVVQNATWNYSNVSKYCKPGDALRLGSSANKNQHSAIFISCNSNSVTVLDNNYNGDNKVAKRTYYYSYWTNFSVSRASNYNTENVTYSTIADGKYTLSNSGYYLNMAKTTQSEDALNALQSAANKTFTITKEDDFYIISAASGNLLNVWCGTSSSDGSRVGLYKNTEGDAVEGAGYRSQRWYFEECDGGYLIHPADAKYLSLTRDSEKLYVKTTTSPVSANQVWELENVTEYAITYDANGGTGAPASQTKVYGTNLTLSSAVPEKDGYTFKGWSTSASGDVEYAAGATYSENSEVTLYAVWEEKEMSFHTSMQAYLNLEGLISMSVGYKFTDMDSINPEDYTEKVGLLLWSAYDAPDEAQAIFDNCSNVIAGAFYNSEMGRFETTTEGIVAKKLGDALTFRAYYLDDNGNYTYGRLISNYSPKTYCYSQITKNADDEEAVELMASILNYGAAAQKFFDYRVDDLMNADLPEELK